MSALGCDLHTVNVYIATGSNLGDRAASLDLADDMLGQLGQVTRVSPTYHTAAVGMAPGTPDFLNRIVEIALEPHWQGEPEAVMQQLLDIEYTMGRRRTDNTPDRPSRSIDLDIVLWDALEIDLPTLKVPHPRMLSRRFVLQPLADLIPDQFVPGTGLTVAELLHALPVDVPQIAPWPSQTASLIATL
jgi:2-amino-4-hydroxy-6-hydroxymethyldihydropteridine diphosphokinase